MKRSFLKKSAAVCVALSVFPGCLASCGKKIDPDSIAAPPTVKRDENGETVNQEPGWSDYYMSPDNTDRSATSKELHDFDQGYFVGALDIFNTYYSFDDPESYWTSWPTEGLVFATGDLYADAASAYRDVVDYLNGMDRSELTDSDIRLLEDMIFDFSYRAEVYDHYDYFPQLNPMGGEQVTYPLLTSLIPFNSKEDVERYFIILEDYDDFFTAALDQETRRAQLGIGWNDEMLDRIIADCQRLIENRDTNFMKTTFESRVGALKLSDTETAEYIRRNNELLDTVFYPTFETLIEGLEALKGSCNDATYLAGTDEGKEYYEALFHLRAGTERSVDECIKLLQDKIDELYDEYLPRWQKSGNIFNFGDLSFQEACDWCQRFMNDHLPKLQDNTVTVFNIPTVFSDSMQPATYYSSPIDRFTKHTVWINTGLIDDPMYTLFTLVSHEMYPGHLYQHQYQAEHLDNKFQVFATGVPYAEGWALYSEWVMFHYAPFDQDQAENSWKASTLYSDFIAARLSIGIEYQGWTYDDCLYYIEKYGQDAEVMQDYWDHITAAQCYGVEYAFGYIFTQEILDHAIEELDGIATQDEILVAYLNLGCAPFEVLEEEMEKYIEEKKG